MSPCTVIRTLRVNFLKRKKTLQSLMVRCSEHWSHFPLWGSPYYCGLVRISALTREWRTQIVGENNNHLFCCGSQVESLVSIVVFTHQLEPGTWLQGKFNLNNNLQTIENCCPHPFIVCNRFLFSTSSFLTFSPLDDRLPCRNCIITVLPSP